MKGIYKITNTITGEIYIGQSKNVEGRFKQHINAAPTDKLHYDIQTLGHDRFLFEYIEEVNDNNELLKREAYYIHILGAFENGYNKNYYYNGKFYVKPKDETDYLTKYEKLFGYSFYTLKQTNMFKPINKVEQNIIKTKTKTKTKIKHKTKHKQSKPKRIDKTNNICWEFGNYPENNEVSINTNDIIPETHRYMFNLSNIIAKYG